MRQWIITILLTVCSLSIFAEGVSTEDIPDEHISLYVEDQKDILRILSWEGFFHPKVIKDFEKKYNVKIEYISYFTRQMRDYIIKSSELRKIDIVVTEQLGVIDYFNSGLLKPLEIDKLSNYKFLDNRLVTNDIAKNYAINVSFGSLGIAYRKDKDFEVPKSWKDFITYNKKLKEKVNLIPDPDDTLDLFIIGKGYDLKNYNLDQLYSSSKILLDFAKNIHSFHYNVTQENDPLIQGDVWMANVYGFEAFQMNKKDNNIDFIYPKEGVKVWRDFLAVVDNGKDSNISWKFLNHVMEPKNAALTSEYNLYSTTNKEAHKYLPPHFVNNKFINPPKDFKFISDEMTNDYIIGKKHYLFKRIIEEVSK